MTELMAVWLAHEGEDGHYHARKMRGHWVVWCCEANCPVDFGTATLHRAMDAHMKIVMR